MPQRPRKFYWTRHADVEMGFVRWTLRYVVNGECFGCDVCIAVYALQDEGRRYGANNLRRIRFHHRMELANLRKRPNPLARSAPSLRD